MKNRKILSFILTIAMITGLALLFAINVSAADIMVAIDTTKTGYRTPVLAGQTTTAPATTGLGLNLSTEKFIAGSAFKVEGYAVDGKWKTGEPTDKDIANLFNKGGVLAVTNKMSAKAKDGPFKGVAKVDCDCGEDPHEPDCAIADAEDSGYIVTFSKIEKRGKTPKLVVNYLIYSDDAGVTAGKWTLSEKGKLNAEKVTNIEYVKPAGKKLEAADEFVAFPDPDPEDGGIDVLLKGDGDKIGGKVTYFIKVSANNDSSKYNPATRAAKINVSAAGKSPKLKPDYKSGVIKVKAGMAVSVDGGTDYILYGKTADSSRGIAVMPAKDKMPEFGTADVKVFSYASDKKPASLDQTIKIATKAAKPTAGITFDGKKFTFAKELEAKTKLTDAKWGKIKIDIPAADKIVDIYVRTKSTAKAIKPNEDNITGFDGTSASDIVKVTIKFTVTGTGADKKTTAEFTYGTP